MPNSIEALQAGRAQARDWPALQALAAQCQTYVPEAGDEVWLLRQAEHIIAYAAWLRLADGAELLGLAVAEAWRRRGLARRLHQLSRPPGRLFLEVRAGNLAAQALYHRLHYRVYGRRRHYYRDGEDALLMCHEPQGIAHECPA